VYTSVLLCVKPSLRFILAFSLFFILSSNLSAQTPADSVKIPKQKDTLHSPKKAAIYSACLPGLGQAYNKKYWKIPIIYAGLGGLAYGAAWNHKYWKQYHNALLIRYDDDPATIDEFDGEYSDNDLVTLKNYYSRYRDLCIIGMAAVYTLNILDAAVDAHLFYFDVGPNLSMRIEPQIYMGSHGISGVIGMQLCWR
jgi:hypothetical protein